MRPLFTLRLPMRLIPLLLLLLSALPAPLAAQSAEPAEPEAVQIALRGQLAGHAEDGAGFTTYTGFPTSWELHPETPQRLSYRLTFQLERQPGAAGWRLRGELDSGYRGRWQRLRSVDAALAPDQPWRLELRPERAHQPAPLLWLDLRATALP